MQMAFRWPVDSGPRWDAGCFKIIAAEDTRPIDVHKGVSYIT